jgi:hypothetical protein
MMYWAHIVAVEAYEVTHVESGNIKGKRHGLICYLAMDRGL